MVFDELSKKLDIQPNALDKALDSHLPKVNAPLEASGNQLIKK